MMDKEVCNEYSRKIVQSVVRGTTPANDFCGNRTTTRANVTILQLGNRHITDHGVLVEFVVALFFTKN